MMLASEVQTLQRIAMFRDVEPAKLKLLAFTGERITYQPGEKIFEEGEASDAVYAIVDGQVEITRLDGGKIVQVGSLGAGSIVGEIGVMCDHDRSVTAVAKAKTCALRMPRQVFIDMMRESPQFALAVTRWLANLTERMVQNLAFPVSG